MFVRFYHSFIIIECFESKKKKSIMIKKKNLLGSFSLIKYIICVFVNLKFVCEFLNKAGVM
jgi:hypothetical protein